MQKHQLVTDKKTEEKEKKSVETQSMGLGIHLLKDAVHQKFLIVLGVENLDIKFTLLGETKAERKKLWKKCQQKLKKRCTYNKVHFHRDNVNTKLLMDTGFGTKIISDGT